MNRMSIAKGCLLLSASFGLLSCNSAFASEVDVPGQSMTPRALACVHAAAKYYYQASDPISYRGFVDLIVAVRMAEGGTEGHVSRNANGSIDIGPMQINSVHLPLLASYGITYNALLNDTCQNIVVGAWILHSEIKAAPTLWAAIGNYNSRTPTYNRRYQLRIWDSLQKVWASRLRQRTAGEGKS
ncbi:MAG: lytic transglycosylase domain-containing protein [Rhodanobacter sp.]